MEIRKIRQLAKLLHAEGLDELELQNGDTYLRLKKAELKQVETVVKVESSVEQPEAPDEIAVEEKEGELIPSPLAGTFYQAKSPGAPPFVGVGEEVATGQTLCILEAMKLMNELEAPGDCTILEILVQDAESVSEGQPLFRVMPK